MGRSLSQILKRSKKKKKIYIKANSRKNWYGNRVS